MSADTRTHSDGWPGIALPQDVVVLRTAVGDGPDGAPERATAAIVDLLRRLRELAAGRRPVRVVTLVLLEEDGEANSAASEAVFAAARGATQALTREAPAGIRSCNVVATTGGRLAEAHRLVELLADPCADYVRGASFDLRAGSR